MRRLHIAPDRLAGWLDRFAAAHGGIDRVESTGSAVTVCALDGAVAECDVPFPPLAVDPVRPFDGLVDHALLDRRFGLVLVRRGGWAVGIADGRRIVASKTGRRYVQSRTAAGGWSQQRYARRRQGQAAELLGEVAAAGAELLAQDSGRLASIICGGDRLLVKTLLADRRLASLRPLVSDRILDVPDPRRPVLDLAAERAIAVRIVVHEPPPHP